MILDLETSIKNRDDSNKPFIGNSSGSPWWPDNNVVLSMWGSDGGTDVHTKWNGVPPPTDSFLIGHNIKFDLLYLLTRYPEWYEWWQRKDTHIFDTQLAEYILTRQTNLYPSLDECTEKYGGTVKDDRIKDFWKSGVDTEDIPKDMLLEYGKQDIVNTRLTYTTQMEQIRSLGIEDLISSQMDGLMGTIEIELNGMYFNKGEALSNATTLLEELEQLEKQLLPTSLPFDFNMSSLQHLAAYLFGGDIKYDGVETVRDDDGEPVKYKSGLKKGQIKTRKCVNIHTFTPLTTPKETWKTPSGKWRVDDKVLKHLCNCDKVGEFCKNLREFRGRVKDVNTYYLGYSSLVWPDGKLHGNLNHTATATGRLSSTSPNLQNLSKGG